ncbi:thiamine ABC transporter substrate-binding protein [Saccharothrix longispora]|uniref:thiamine ABC transporter substrate-binding protein n=1 Tax=Saccharothrix longispora TaxID=33920 RepID=UPI0028FD2B9C|nr:thiamine ABC transporter substrate-binding protein [Saccharothrix longispora]MBY8848024.1 thiamine ABC transporter substrate-binding protein [Saccharothrix sp. MB29]MDU0293123.1 thiamine ABC transporter substrate-binding protein [Saccharothrix longispora]
MLRRALTAATAFALLTGCSVTTGQAPADQERVVTLVTHDSFALSQELLDGFKADTGITVKPLASGDAGEVTNKLVLTKDNPIGDVAFGVDSTFASRALKEGVFAEHASPEADKGAQRYRLDPPNRLHAVDVGDVCLNIDVAALEGVGEPTQLAQLADPKYRDMLVVQDPATSSPGLAFLLATIATFGEANWRNYWGQLAANGVKVVSGWEEAYTQDFSGSSGKGPRPIVVSYASSPSAEIDDDGQPRTKALLDTCYRQVEYAGVLNGAKNPEDAKKVVDFLLSEAVQADVPGQMYVYPSREGVALPEAWAKAAPLPTSSRSLPADEVDANRERWVQEWRTIVQG